MLKDFIKHLPKRLKNTSAKMKIDKMASVYPITEKASITKAVEFLVDGQVIAVPTDTIYGLACNANSPDAIRKLYSIKGRDAGKPVAICVSHILDVRKWGEAGHLSNDLLSKLLPGAVTVVLEKTKNLDNPYLNPSTTKIGIRIPKHSFINAITANFDMPIALTSANFSSEPSTLNIKEFQHLYHFLGAVFDGGVLSNGLQENRTGSTVIDLSKDGFYKIIRKGISFSDTVKVLENFGLKSAIT